MRVKHIKIFDCVLHRRISKVTVLYPENTRAEKKLETAQCKF